MKKKLYLITTILLSAVALSLSSCLKNSSNYTDFGQAGTIVEFPLGGSSYFSKAAITDPGDTITKQFAVVVAAANTPKTATPITIAVDNSIATAYDTANPAIDYLPMPTGSYVLTKTTATIPANQNTAVFSVTFYKNKLDASKSYMLPIKIADAGGLNISGNMGIFYYHFIGNPFAGSYTQNFYRYNNYNTSNPPPVGTAVSGGSFTGQQVTIYPVNPTQFEVTSGYYTQLVNYEVSFTQIDATHYGNFQVSFKSTDVANDWTPNGINLTQQPVFGYGITPAYDPNASYTYAQALSYFTFQYVVNTGADRFLVDQYIHN
ncbi:MAG: DUF1735 domain-containing protein [Candidatus Saccharimonadales bacterium]